MREVLVQEGHDQGWSERARSLTDGLRLDHAFLRDTDEGRPDDADARRWADSAAGRGRGSKFAPCLPDDALTAYLAERLMDVEGAWGAVDSAASSIASPLRPAGLSPSGTRGSWPPGRGPAP
jgi:hypothetical protein